MSDCTSLDLTSMGVDVKSKGGRATPAARKEELEVAQREGEAVLVHLHPDLLREALLRSVRRVALGLLAVGRHEQRHDLLAGRVLAGQQARQVVERHTRAATCALSTCPPTTPLCGRARRRRHVAAVHGMDELVTQVQPAPSEPCIL